MTKTLLSASAHVSTMPLQVSRQNQAAQSATAKQQVSSGQHELVFSTVMSQNRSRILSQGTALPQISICGPERPSQTAPQTNTPPTQTELNWSQDLENHIQMGYRPTPQEFALYQNIQKRFEAFLEKQLNQKDLVSSEEMDWAKMTQRRVMQGESVAPWEETWYNDIYTRLQEQNTGFTPTENPEQAWARELGSRMMQGYPATPQELTLFQHFLSPNAARPPVELPKAPQTPVSQEELNWALKLEEEVKQEYQPHFQETQRYENIARRLMEAQQSSAPLPEPHVHGPAEWKIDFLN